MKNFRLITAMHHFFQKGYYVPLERHQHYELVYYRYGLGDTMIGNQKLSFSPHTFVVMPPNVWHNETHQQDCELIYMRIETTETLPTGFFKDENELVYRIAEAIVNETFTQHMSYKDMILLKLNELAITLDRFTQDHTAPNHAKNFEYVTNYITESYHNKIVFKDLAAQLNYSYDYFQHRFKELTGFSPQQYLIRQRIAAAENMLINESISCTEIAYRCGFSNSTQFSAIFKREKGISPKKYRNENKMKSTLMIESINK